MPGSSAHETVQARWRRELEVMAIPERLLQAAPETPHRFPVEVFARVADELRGADTPSTRRALEALPDEDGSVLDVGCGAGAASLPLVPPAARLAGVDESRELLDAFAARAAALGVEHEEVEGRWPDVEGVVPITDIVVSRNVVYNVPELDTFAVALDRHARRRVIVELTASHPLAWMRPYWHDLQGFDRPEGPTAQDALAVLDALDLEFTVERWSMAWSSGQDPEARIAFLGRKLGIGEDRDDEIRSALAAHGFPEEREIVTIWWDIERG